MKLRPVTMADALDLLAWRNDPQTRAMSRHGGEVALQDHVDWLVRSLASSERRLVMGEDAATGTPIGMVRFDRQGPTWEVGINLSPARRGQGLGRTLLALAVTDFQKKHKAAALTATIRPENQASVKVFAACGFLPNDDSSEDGFRRFRLP